MTATPESTRPAWTINNPKAFTYWMKTGASELPADWVDGEKTARYFTDSFSVWKFEKGKHPMHRDVEETHWEESAFAGLAEFFDSPGDTREITAEDGGEP